jgi:glyoxylase-like metal-dependent hydrolase (beta-lactamase superfamily II)
MLLIESFPVGSFQCNCSILACEETKEALVVDPGGDPERILEVIRHYNLTVRAAVHTHAHLDHIAATRDIKEATGCTIHLHPEDRFLYDGFAWQAAMFGWQVRDVLPIDEELRHQGQVAFGRRAVQVLHTPGHTPGSVCFHLAEAQAHLLLSGDTLFRRSVGRTDLPGGDKLQLGRSIREHLYALPPDTTVIPGHGPKTTIGEEMSKNPFVRVGS